MTEAGVSIQSALATLQKSAPRAMRNTVARLSAAINRGESLHQALEQNSRHFPSIDRHTIAVSEQSGALEIGLLALNKYHEDRHAARGRIITASILPVLIMVAAVFIAHFPALVLGTTVQGDSYSSGDYFRDTIGFLVILVAIGIGAVWLTRTLFKVPGLNVTLDNVLRHVPVFGRLRYTYALSQWISAIRLMLRAGHGILPAMEYSSKMSPSPLIGYGYQKAQPLLNSSLDVSQALQSTGVFPDQLIQFWATGEKSGRMDDMLDRLAKQYEEQWRKSLDLVSVWLPRIAYGLVMVYVVIQMAKLLGPLLGTYQELLQ